MEVSSDEFLPDFLNDEAHEIETLKDFLKEDEDNLKQFRNDISKLIHLYGEPKGNIAQLKIDVEKLGQKIKDCTIIVTKLEAEKIKVLSTQQMCKQEMERLTEEKQEILRHIEVFKSEKEKNEKELKNMHEAVKLAIYYYKSALDIYVHIKDETEDCTLTKVYFSKEKKDEQHVLLLKKDAIDEWGRINKSIIAWELLEMCPMVKKFDTLQKRLKETNDIQGFLYAVETTLKEKIET